LANAEPADSELPAAETRNPERPAGEASDDSDAEDEDVESDLPAPAA